MSKEDLTHIQSIFEADKMELFEATYYTYRATSMYSVAVAGRGVIGHG